MNLMKRCLAELIGTATLVLVGCGVAALTGCNGGINVSYVLTAIAFGLVIVGLAYSPIGRTSGCHINPAVSVGVWLTGGMTITELIAYVIFQCGGAVLGAAVLQGIIGSDFGLGANALYAGSAVKSVIIEAILTCIFVSAVLGATSDKKDSSVAGLVIGGALTLVHLLGIPLTGTSVNPARSLGPALLMGGDALSSVVFFFIGPVLGAVVAAGLFLFFRQSEIRTSHESAKQNDVVNPQDRDHDDIFIGTVEDSFINVDENGNPEAEEGTEQETICADEAASDAETTEPTAEPVTETD